MSVEDPESQTHDTVQNIMSAGASQDNEEKLASLYELMKNKHMVPLWTQIGDLMPNQPTPKAVPYMWRWRDILPVAEHAGDLVPVGRGGERRAIALANPGFGGQPYIAPTLWAAIQYLGGHEVAPEHRHSQNAFRFVVEGEGVWTVVNGDPVAMRRGDLLLTPGWNFHGHHNDTDQPMAWLDGLDIPLVQYIDTGFFEFGIDRVTDDASPETSRSERLWANPGLRPLSALDPTVNSPIGAYRWENTDRALTEQLKLEDEGYPATVEPGHAAIRYINPTTGGDIMSTIRAEFHRMKSAVSTRAVREVGSSVYQVFSGAGEFILDGKSHEVETGDIVVVPSWTLCKIQTELGLDMFKFGDQPMIERLNFHRRLVEEEQ